MKSPRHILLASGFALLGGAVAVAILLSNNGSLPDVPVSVRTASPVVRSSRSGAEFLPDPSATRAAFKAFRPESGGGDARTFGTTTPETRSLLGGSLPVADLQSGQADRIESGLPDQSEFTRPISAAPSQRERLSTEQPWIVTDPSAPGSRLSSGDLVVSVNAAKPVQGSSGVTLSVVVTDMPADQSALVDTPAVEDVQSADGDSQPVAGRFAGIGGFTYEQQLFRTKWGWAAYDQVQKLLRDEASD